MLYGTSDAEPQTDIIVAQLAQELYNSNLLLLLIQNLNRIDFEVRKLRTLMFQFCCQKKKNLYNFSSYRAKFHKLLL
jgi:hypothetical protein